MTTSISFICKQKEVTVYEQIRRLKQTPLKRVQIWRKLDILFPKIFSLDIKNAI